MVADRFAADFRPAFDRPATRTRHAQAGLRPDRRPGLRLDSVMDLAFIKMFSQAWCCTRLNEQQRELISFRSTESFLSISRDAFVYDLTTPNSISTEFFTRSRKLLETFHKFFSSTAENDRK